VIKYKVAHHQLIRSVLENFNADFFYKNTILFGGGTRIALEISEYRESIDVDFLCPDQASYRSVREQVTSHSLGELVKEDFNYVRDIAFDRYGTRTFIDINDTKIKIEFVSFENYQLVKDEGKLFPLPYIDRTSCFYTKLLANADRCLSPPFKDIYDLLAMSDAWGGIPQEAFAKAEMHYGSSIRKQLRRSLEDIINNEIKYLKAAESMLIDKSYSLRLVRQTAKDLLNSLDVNS
jgi:hypothetical protein